MTTKGEIRVSVIEDSFELNKALEYMISGATGFRCISTHLNGEDAAKKLIRNPPDIVLVDLGLPGMSGQECIELLKEEVPNLQFLVLTIRDQDEQVFSAIKAGANGYLLKNASPAEIITAIKELNDGGAPMSAAIARKVVSHFRQDKESQGVYAHLLTSREKEVLECLSEGKYYKEIADELHISIETVKSHCHNIYEKLHVSTRTEALNKYYSR
jgi:DNA-binding NarL/FixJ family response regulator